MRKVSIRSKTVRRITYGAIIISVIILAATNTHLNTRNDMALAGSGEANSTNLPIIAVTAMKKYDGTDPSLPIYIGYEGYVYDVSAGSEYYKPGGSYHYIAGTDATQELRMFGGEIIKKKYPVVALYK